MMIIASCEPSSNLTAHNLQKEKVHALHEAVGLYLKNMIFVDTWNLGQFSKNLVFC